MMEKCHQPKRRRRSRSKYTFVAVSKQFKSVYKQYKHFAKAIINHIAKKYKYCHLQRNIEVDFLQIVSILIVSDGYITNPSLEDITADDCVIIKSNISFADFLAQMHKMLHLSYDDMKYIIRSLQYVAKFNHIIKKPQTYLRQLAKQMTIRVYIIYPKSHNVSFSKQKLQRLLTELKRNICARYMCCLLNHDFHLVTELRRFHYFYTKVSILFVANYHNDIEQDYIPQSAHHTVMKYTSSSSLLQWFSVSVKRDLSLSYEHISEIINAIYRKLYATKNDYKKRKLKSNVFELTKFAQELSLYADYKCKKYWFSLQKSGVLVRGYIFMITKQLYSMQYIPECIVNEIIHFVHFEKTDEMRRCDEFRIIKVENNKNVWKRLRGPPSHTCNALISKLEFKPCGVYSFKLGIIYKYQWPRCYLSCDRKLRIGVVEDIDDIDIETVNECCIFSLCSLSRWGDNIEMIVNLTESKLCLMRIAWYLNGTCYRTGIFHYDNAVYSPFIAVHDCNDIQFCILY